MLKVGTCAEHTFLGGSFFPPPLDLQSHRSLQVEPLQFWCQEVDLHALPVGGQCMIGSAQCPV
eukprot:2603961-Prorocentrum_lima.AAC.1